MNETLEAFRSVQQLAYRCVEHVAAELEPGITEKQAAAKLTRWLERAGIDDWFHRPFAWFGDRTAFSGRWHPLKFFPTSRRLEHGMPFILDVAPVVKGVAADVGFSGALGHNAIVDKMKWDLREYRALILSLVRQRVSFGEVSDAVAALARTHGYDVRHTAYPFEVLAHLVSPLAAKPSRGTIGGFGLRALYELGRKALEGRQDGWSPLWNARSNHAPTPGVWAVEPHLGFHGVGVKFEELLVITQTDAHWLDDDLPHVRGWKNDHREAA